MMPMYEAATNYNAGGNSLNCPRALNYGRTTRLGSDPSGVIEPGAGQLGLPSDYVQHYTDMSLKGAPLPRPYGPRDNYSLLQGFGARSGSSKGPKGSKGSKRTPKVSFGATPGTDLWRQHVLNYDGQQYANPGVLKAAKGSYKPDITYFQQGQDFDQRFNLRVGNAPMQYQNNEYNSPLYSFGARRAVLPRSGARRAKKTLKFGSRAPEISAGPNNVGYEKMIPMYHGGADTMNFDGRKLFGDNLIKGPTNSIGPYANMPYTGKDIGLYKVLPDGMTPNSYLSAGPGIRSVSANTVNNYVYKGTNGFGRSRFGRNQFGRNQFGQNAIVYQPELVTSGTGLLTLYQPYPQRIIDNLTSVQGSYVNYGRKKSKKPNKTSMGAGKSVKATKTRQRPRLTSRSSSDLKELRTVYNGNVITLNKTGKFTITKSAVPYKEPDTCL
jgi:hypothetical protein